MRFSTGSTSLVGVALLLAAGSTAPATPTIVVGNYNLLPNTPNQGILVSVSGADAVTGTNIRAVLGDGISGNLPEPAFTAVSYAGGTIWDGKTGGFSGGPIGPPQGANQDVQGGFAFDTAGVSTPASGIFVKLTVDTTGFFSGTFPLKFSGTEIGANTNFLGLNNTQIAANITNGTVTIPEPASGLLLLAGGAAGLLSRRHRQRSPSSI